MNKTRNIGLIIVSVGLILLILVIYFTFFYGSKPIEEPIIDDSPSLDVGLPDADEPLIIQGDRPRGLKVYDISQEEEHVAGIEDVLKLAMSFTERIGSFSNQSDYRNITDAQLFMTNSLREWSKSYINRLKAENPVDSFYSISTSSLSTKTIKYNESSGEAEVMVTTHRSENKEDVSGENTWQEDLLLELKKENDIWKVNAIYWQD
jgi:hypothetical protein